MSKISDIIEKFIIDTIGDDERVVLSRNQLAEFFDCAPSQINYVLSTRFTIDRGYVIESQRGGGGHITVLKISEDKDEYFNTILNESLKDGINFNRASHILERLHTDKIITKKEMTLLTSAVSDKAIQAPSELRDFIRAGIIKSILTELMK